MPSILSNATTTSVMNGLQSNPVRKLLFINMATMVVPRISISYSRNRYAGQETALYEFAGLFANFALPGLLGLAAASVLGKKNNPLGIRTTGWTKTEYLDSFAEIYKKSVNTVYGQSLRKNMRPETLEHFIRSVLQNLEVLDPLHSRPTRLNEKQLKQFTAEIQALMESQKPNAKTTTQSIAKDLAKTLGSYDRLILKGKKDITTQSDTLIKHLNYLGKEFQKSHTTDVPAQITENVGKIVKKLHKSINVKSGLSMAVWLGLACSLQFINRAITKRRTGQSGFVGYSDFSQQNEPNNNKAQSRSLSVTPSAAQPAAAPSSQPNMPVMNPQVSQPAVPTVAANSAPTQTMPNSMPQPVQFSGFMPNLRSSQFLPTTEQLRLVYPLGALARLLASRDLNEFRETLVLSGFGCLSFLFIPNLVENLIAHAFKNKNIFSKIPELNLHTGNASEKLKNGFHRLNKSSIRSYQDIEAYSKKLGEQLANKSDKEIRLGLSTVLRQMSPELKNMSELGAEEKAKRIATAVAKELNGIKNVSSIAGIVYSCLTLGIVLNLWNVYITNKRRARELAKQGKQAQLPLPTNASPPAPVEFAMGPSPLAGSNNPFQAFLKT